MNIKLSDILYDDNNSEVTKIFEEQDKKAKIGDPMEKVNADNIVINNAFITQLQDRFPEIIARIDKDFTNVSSGWSKYYESQKEGKPNKKLLKDLVTTSLKPLGVLTKADIKKLMTRSIPLPRVGAMHGNAAQVTAGKSQIEGFLNTDFKIYQDRQVVPVFLENQLGEPLSGANNSKGGFGLLFLIPAVGAAIKKENIALYQGLFLDNPSEFKEDKVNIFTNAKKVHVLPITEENVDKLAVAFKSSQALLTFAKKYNTSTSFKSTQLNIESKLVHVKGLGQLLESNSDEDPPKDPFDTPESEDSESTTDSEEFKDWLEYDPKAQSVSLDLMTLDDLENDILSSPIPPRGDAKKSSESPGEEDSELQQKMLFLKNIMEEDNISSINYFKVKENINSLIGLDKEALESISNLKAIEFDENISKIKDDYIIYPLYKDLIRDEVNTLRKLDNTLKNDAKFVITNNNLISEKTDTTHFDLPVTIPVIVISQHSSSGDMVCENVLLQLKGDLASKFEVASPEEALSGISLEDLEQILQSLDYKEANKTAFSFYRSIKDGVQKLVQSSESKKDDEEKEIDDESKKVEGKNQKEKVQNRIKSKLPASESINVDDLAKNLKSSLNKKNLDDNERKVLKDKELKNTNYQSIIKSRKDFFSKNTDYRPPEEELNIESLLQNVLTPKMVKTFILRVVKQFKKDNIGDEFDIEEIRKKAREAATKKKSPMRNAYNKLINVIDKFSKRDFLAKPNSMSFEKYKALTVLYMLLMMDKKLVLMEGSFIPGYIQGSLTNLLLNEEKEEEEENLIRDLTTGEVVGAGAGSAATGAFAYLGLKTYAGLGLLGAGGIGLAVTGALAYAWAETVIDQTDIDKVENELICYLAYPTAIQADMNEYVNSLKLAEDVEKDIEEIANEIEKNSPSQSDESQGGQSQSRATSSLPSPKQMTLVSQSQLTEIEVIEKLIEGNKASGKIKINELQELVEKIQGFKKELSSFKEQMKDGSELINIIKGLQDNKGLNTYNKLKESNSESFIKKLDKVYDYKENPGFAKAFPNLVLTKCCIEISAAFFKEKANLSGEEKEKQNFVAITEDFIQKKGFNARFKYAKKLFDIKYKSLDEALAAQQVGETTLESGQVFEDDYTSQVMNAINKIDVDQVENELKKITSLIAEGDEKDKKKGGDDISSLNELIETINLEIESLSEKEDTITAVRDLSESDRSSRRNALKVIINSMVAEKNSHERKKAEVALKQKNKLSKEKLDAANRALSSKNDNKLIGGFGVGGLLSVLGGVGTAIACPPLAIPAIVGSVFGVAPAGMAGAWLASSSEEGQAFVPEELKFNEYSEVEINKNLNIVETCISQLIEKALNENKYVYKKGLRFLLEDSEEAIEIEKSRLEKANRFKSASRRKKLKRVDGKLYVTQKDLEATLLGNAFDLYLNNKSAISSETYREFLKNLGSIIKFYHNVDVEEAAKESPSGIVRDVIFNSKDFNLKEVVGGTIEQLRKACKDAEGSDPFFNAIEEAFSSEGVFSPDGKVYRSDEEETNQDKRTQKDFDKINFKGRDVYKEGINENLKDGPVIVDLDQRNTPYILIHYASADKGKRIDRKIIVKTFDGAIEIDVKNYEFDNMSDLLASEEIAKFIKASPAKKVKKVLPYFNVNIKNQKTQMIKHLRLEGKIKVSDEIEEGNENFDQFAVKYNVNDVVSYKEVDSGAKPVKLSEISRLRQFIGDIGFQTGLDQEFFTEDDLTEIESSFAQTKAWLDATIDRSGLTNDLKELYNEFEEVYEKHHKKYPDTVRSIRSLKDSIVVSDEEWDDSPLDPNALDELPPLDFESTNPSDYADIPIDDILIDLLGDEEAEGTGDVEDTDENDGSHKIAKLDMSLFERGKFKEKIDNLLRDNKGAKNSDKIVAYSKVAVIAFSILKLKGYLTQSKAAQIINSANTLEDIFSSLHNILYDYSMGPDFSDVDISDEETEQFDILNILVDKVKSNTSSSGLAVKTIFEAFYGFNRDSGQFRFDKSKMVSTIKKITNNFVSMSALPAAGAIIRTDVLLKLVNKHYDEEIAETAIRLENQNLLWMIFDAEKKISEQAALIEKFKDRIIDGTTKGRTSEDIHNEEGTLLYKIYYDLFKKYLKKLQSKQSDVEESILLATAMNLQVSADANYKKIENLLSESEESLQEPNDSELKAGNKEIKKDAAETKSESDAETDEEVAEEISQDAPEQTTQVKTAESLETEENERKKAESEKGVEQVNRENEESAEKPAKAAKRFDQQQKDTSKRKKLSSKQKQRKLSRKRMTKASQKRNRQNSGYEPLGSVLSEFNTNLYQQSLSSLLFEDKDYNRQQKVIKQSSLQEEWRRLWDI